MRNRERLKRLEQRAKLDPGDRCLVILAVGKSEEQVKREIAALNLRPNEIVVIMDA